jgi:hypothetical protein
MVAVILLSVVLGLMVCGFAAFYIHSRTPAWGDSDMRKSMLSMLMVIGPIFGMHYRAPRPEPPAISTAGDDTAGDAPDVIIPPRKRSQGGDPQL